MKKNLNFKEEINKSLDTGNYRNILIALFCKSTNTEIEAGKKIIESMINNSIEDVEKKLAAIDNNIDTKEN